MYLLYYNVPLKGVHLYLKRKKIRKVEKSNKNVMFYESESNVQHLNGTQINADLADDHRLDLHKSV